MSFCGYFFCCRVSRGGSSFASHVSIVPVISFHFSILFSSFAVLNFNDDTFPFFFWFLEPFLESTCCSPIGPSQSPCQSQLLWWIAHWTRHDEKTKWSYKHPREEIISKVVMIETPKIDQTLYCQSVGLTVLLIQPSIRDIKKLKFWMFFS